MVFEAHVAHRRALRHVAIETVAKLVELGAAREALATDERTPLHYAAYAGHTETVAKLGELVAAFVTWSANR